MGSVIALLGAHSLLQHVLVLHGVTAYLVVAAFCAGEAAVIVGFVIPNETAVVLGGVLASEHKVTLSVMALTVVVAAVVGDSVGFEIGRRFGPRFLSRRVLRRQRAAIERAQELLARRGGLGVFLGRWTAILRAMVPGLTGMSGMPYGRFLVANALGGTVWGLTFLLLGYSVGSSVQRISSVGSYVFLALVLIGVTVLHLRRRARDKRDNEFLRCPVEQQS